MLAKMSPEFSSELIKISTELSTIGKDINKPPTTTATIQSLGTSFFTITEKASTDTSDVFLYSGSNQSSVIKNIQNKLNAMIYPEGQIVFGGDINSLDIDNYNYKMSSDYIVTDYEYFKYYDNVSVIEYNERDMIIWM
jgi:hypothetical protein